MLHRELEVDVAADAELGRFGHDPVAIDLVLEVIDPGSEVRPLRVEEEGAHLLGVADAGRQPQGSLAHAALQVPRRGCDRPYLSRPRPRPVGARWLLAPEPGGKPQPRRPRRLPRP